MKDFQRLTVIAGRIVFLFISLLIVSSNHTLLAIALTEIQIDNDNRQLIAPEGKSYNWYFNGKLVENKERKFKVKKSGNYKVEIADEKGEKTIETISIVVKADGIRKIYIIGDSTVSTYNASAYPMMGWGQVLNLFFDASKIQVTNKAIGGRSSRSFWEEGRWTEVVNMLDSNDYVFIQFGHNDRDYTKPERYTDTADYKDYLRIYVNETRQKGATPVLVSPMIMNAWNGTIPRNVFTEGENNYRGAMFEVAEELDALFVDLNMKSYDLVKELGQEYAARFLHMSLDPGEYPNYPDGSTDGGTHYQEMGALEMAKLIVEGIIELEEDTTMSFLVDALVPTSSVTTAISLPDAGLITIPGTYPIGSHITLRTRLNSINSFHHWEDTLGNNVSNDNLFMFTMEDSAYYYKAIVDDCNGETGGEAGLDSCWLCSGGSAEYPPCKVIFESEDACIYTGRAQLSHIGEYDRTIVNTSIVEGSPYIEYKINASVAGTYDFVFVYLSRISGEQLSISVNGAEIFSALDLVQAEEWNLLRFQLDLDEGLNSVLINSLAAEGGIQLDLLASYSNNLSVGECNAVSTSSIQKGSKCSAFPNPFADAITIQTEGHFEYRIYNTIGVEVLQGFAEYNCSVGSGLPKGAYILHTINDSENSIQFIQKY